MYPAEGSFIDVAAEKRTASKKKDFYIIFIRIT